MNLTVTRFLRNALLIDFIGSGATTLLLMFGSHVLAPLLGLPADFLFWIGVNMVPFLALLLVAARREVLAKGVLVAIIGINAAWVLASALLLVSGVFAPTLLGYGFVIAQAVAVALFAGVQYGALRRTAAIAKPAI